MELNYGIMDYVDCGDSLPNPQLIRIGFIGGGAT